MTDNPEDLKPVAELTAEDLLAEMLEFDRYRNREPERIQVWVHKRLKALDAEMQRRLRAYDQMSKVNVISFAQCLGLVHRSLWRAHGGRDLTQEEQEELRTLLSDFYVNIK
jgi:hypothetical protein